MPRTRAMASPASCGGVGLPVAGAWQREEGVAHSSAGLPQPFAWLLASSAPLLPESPLALPPVGSRLVSSIAQHGSAPPPHFAAIPFTPWWQAGEATLRAYAHLCKARRGRSMERIELIIGRSALRQAMQRWEHAHEEQLSADRKAACERYVYQLTLWVLENLHTVSALTEGSPSFAAELGCTRISEETLHAQDPEQRMVFRVLRDKAARLGIAQYRMALDGAHTITVLAPYPFTASQSPRVAFHVGEMQPVAHYMLLQSLVDRIDSAEADALSAALPPRTREPEQLPPVPASRRAEKRKASELADIGASRPAPCDARSEGPMAGRHDCPDDRRNGGLNDRPRRQSNAAVVLSALVALSERPPRWVPPALSGSTAPPVRKLGGTKIPIHTLLTPPEPSPEGAYRPGNRDGQDMPRPARCEGHAPGPAVVRVSARASTELSAEPSVAGSNPPISRTQAPIEPAIHASALRQISTRTPEMRQSNARVHAMLRAQVRDTLLQRRAEESAEMGIERLLRRSRTPMTGQLQDHRAAIRDYETFLGRRCTPEMFYEDLHELCASARFAPDRKTAVVEMCSVGNSTPAHYFIELVPGRKIVVLAEARGMDPLARAHLLYDPAPRTIREAARQMGDGGIWGRSGT